jgi:hypothetical protein
MIFLTESKEIFDASEADIIIKFLKPVESKCSAQIDGRLWFQVDFRNYAVK